MRYLIVSDLHSNLEALEAVLADARAQGFERAVCLGDLVGYGASPNEVVDLVRGLGGAVIRGNHDKVIAGIETGEQFNVLALQSSLWTREQLSEENLRYLAQLPRGPASVDGEFWIAHGTPLDEDAYILNDFDAMAVFRSFPERVCFFGHSHIPTLFALDDEEGFYLVAPLGDDESFELRPAGRYLVNCGSVGQPRDRNSKAAYGIYDTERRTITVRRVAYSISDAQKRILGTGLPRFLAERLAFGV